MSGGVHIYRAPSQPATRFEIFFDKRHIFRYAKRHLFPCRKCRKMRWAANLVTQVYYDAQYFWCREGKGCKG